MGSAQDINFLEIQVNNLLLIIKIMVLFRSLVSHVFIFNRSTTVNTAARMESNGAGEKIHISQQTADHLNKSGREDWYFAREEKIVAKGKGELQLTLCLFSTCKTGILNVVFSSKLRCKVSYKPFGFIRRSARK